MFLLVTGLFWLVYELRNYDRYVHFDYDGMPTVLDKKTGTIYIPEANYYLTKEGNMVSTIDEEKLFADLKLYYEHLKLAGVPVGDTFESFKKTLNDEEKRKKYYDYLSSNKNRFKIKVPKTYKLFEKKLFPKSKENENSFEDIVNFSEAKEQQSTQRTGLNEELLKLIYSKLNTEATYEQFKADFIKSPELQKLGYSKLNTEATYEQFRVDIGLDKPKESQEEQQVLSPTVNVNRLEKLYKKYGYSQYGSYEDFKRDFNENPKMRRAIYDKHGLSKYGSYEEFEQDFAKSKELEKLYNAISKKYNVGTFTEFSIKMQTTEQRKSFYESVKAKGIDLGDYEVYEQRLSQKEE